MIPESGRLPEITATKPGRLRVLLAASALCLCLAVPATAGIESIATFAIDARMLSPALLQFSRQSGLSVAFSERLTGDMPAQPVIGDMRAAEALDTLLNGSGLGWELVDGSIVAIYEINCDPEDERCDNPGGVVRDYPVFVPGMEETHVYGRRVTGSRIRRAGDTGGAPVDILSAPDIERSGAQTLGELLKFLPAVAGNSTSTAISNGGDGTATVTLRGLPASNTLVLINGRRTANDGLAGDSVDLNSIPPGAVERVEILKDGASAIYGSDAIAGVVNIIMKHDTPGVLAETYFGEAEAGDLQTRNDTLQYGASLPRGSFFISASRFKQDPLYSRDRAISRNADTRPLGGSDQRSSATPSARVTLPSGETLIATGDTYRPATSEDLFNYQAFTTAVVPLERAGLFASASYDLGDRVSALVDLSYIDTDAEATLAPTPVFTAFEQVPLTVSADNRYNPFGTDLQDIRRRILELAPRRQRNKSEVTRFTAGVEGLHDSWYWDVGVHWSRSEAAETVTGIVNADNLRRGIGPADACLGLAIDGCVAVDLLGPNGSISSEQADFIEARGEVSGYSKLSGASANFSRSITAMPFGRGDVAWGAEYRQEATQKRPSALFAETRTIGATNFQATRGERQITEMYLETVLPLWKNESRTSALDLESALRYSHYSDFGNTVNPKVVLHLQLGPSVLLRANYAEGFRAPSLNELYEGATEEQAFLTDPCTLPQSTSSLPGCTQQADDTRNQFLTITGGNRALEPETADSYSAGVVWTPPRAPGLSLSADYFLIDQDDVVASSAQFLVDQNARFGLYADKVQRDSMGNLVRVDATNINVGRRRVSGADLALTYHLPRRGWGQLSLISSASWIREYLAGTDRTAPELELAGTFRDEASEGLGGIPEWKAQLALRWNRERWRGSYEIHHVSSMEEVVPDTLRTRSIDSWTVHDLQLSYTFDLFDGLRWTLGVDNALDTEAPLAASAFNDNIDGRTHELRGRFCYLRLSQRF
jgi:iron complex outermembrane receptor protein